MRVEADGAGTFGWSGTLRGADRVAGNPASRVEPTRRCGITPALAPSSSGTSFALDHGEDIAMGSSLSGQTDTQLHDSVQRQLEWDPEVEAHDVAVIASEGVITLAGFVHSYAAKLAAERSVKRVQGVRGVANEIQVAPPTERTDTDIARGAVYALRAHANVPMSVKITARNGYLTLEGQVEWKFEKDAAADAVAHLDGVKGVSNEITVKPSVAVAEVKADIDAAIRRCADVDARHVLVSVNGSVVTLSGEVASWHELQEAERAAWSAPGITRVENLIAVTPSLAKGENPWSLR